MNKRDEQKIRTRKKIISVAEELFTENGIINTKTVDIAKTAGIAHGTLFSHFETRDILVEKILNRKIDGFQKQFLEKSKHNQDFFSIIDQFIDLLTENESFFSVIFRELPMFDKNLRNIIVFRFSIIELYMLKLLEDFLSSSGAETNIKPDTIIQHFFSLIIHYLTFREILNFDDSVISDRKQTLIDTLEFFIYGGMKNG